ncbi:putative SAM dependent methyltransferase [Ilyonectria robusta]
MNLAPLSDKPQRVLDIGTGTGIWAIDFAEYASYLITDRMMADLTQRESFR